MHLMVLVGSGVDAQYGFLQGTRNSSKHHAELISHNGTNFFSAPIDISVDLDDEEKRAKYRRVLLLSTSQDLGKQEICPIYHDGETISGKVVLRARSGGQFAHGGVTIRIVGAIDDLLGAAGGRPPNIFLSSSLTLAPAGSAELLELPFTFGALSLQHESFEGNRIHVRYSLQVTMKRSISDRTFERTLWIQNRESLPSTKLPTPRPKNLGVGLEEMLQLAIRMEDSEFDWKGIIKGQLHFEMVQVPIISADLCILRREMMGPLPTEKDIPFTVPSPEEFISRFQILDGPAERGDQIPFRFHLASCLDEHSATTKVDAHGLYAIKYFAFFELQDTENRRFYKAQEIIIRR